MFLFVGDNKGLLFLSGAAKVVIGKLRQIHQRTVTSLRRVSLFARLRK